MVRWRWVQHTVTVPDFPATARSYAAEDPEAVLDARLASEQLGQRKRERDALGCSRSRRMTLPGATSGHFDDSVHHMLAIGVRALRHLLAQFGRPFGKRQEVEERQIG